MFFHVLFLYPQVRQTLRVLKQRTVLTSLDLFHLPDLTMHDPAELRKNNPSSDVTVDDPKRPFVTDVVTSVGKER